MATTNTNPLQDIIAQGVGVVMSIQNATKNNISSNTAILISKYPMIIIAIIANNIIIGLDIMILIVFLIGVDMNV